jgi:hypothetical protein
MSEERGRVMGNREVSHPLIRGARGDLSAAGVAAFPLEEGGPWGKHGFPHETKPKAEEFLHA